ncbi:hypothetical protein KBC04_02615 [Candidatus Babeliales bacterium]|nr:hypothetical protein [Candidatus Babeliales bacterium]MBP9844055.1 hypothetical protein [Candidatus Babeliales bacterium]
MDYAVQNNAVEAVDFLLQQRGAAVNLQATFDSALHMRIPIWMRTSYAVTPSIINSEIEKNSSIRRLLKSHGAKSPGEIEEKRNEDSQTIQLMFGEFKAQNQNDRK